jgi:hypothetical protein
MLTSAAAFLLDALAAGPVGADSLIELAKCAGLRWSEVKRASFDLGVTSHAGAYGVQIWTLPAKPRPQPRAQPINVEPSAMSPPDGYDPTPGILLGAVDELVDLHRKLMKTCDGRPFANRIASRLVGTELARDLQMFVPIGGAPKASNPRPITTAQLDDFLAEYIEHLYNLDPFTRTMLLNNLPNYIVAGVHEVNAALQRLVQAGVLGVGERVKVRGSICRKAYFALPPKAQPMRSLSADPADDDGETVPAKPVIDPF